MKSEIIKIGNSQGIIIPKTFMKELDLNLGGIVEITLSPQGELIIRKPSNPREGWEEDAKQAASEWEEEDEEWINMKDLPEEIEGWDWPDWHMEKMMSSEGDFMGRLLTPEEEENVKKRISPEI